MRLLLNCTKEDKQHKPALVRLLGAEHMAMITSAVMDQTSLLAAATRKEIKADAIICNNPDTLKNLVPGTGNPSDWRGSVLRFSTPVLCVNPFDHLRTMPHGEWLLKQDLTKLDAIHHPAKKLSYDVIKNATALSTVFNTHRDAYFLVIDIETSKTNLITCIGFTFCDKSVIAGEYNFYNYIVPFDIDYWRNESEFNSVVTYLREYLSSTDMPKCFHNGAYDTYHLLRYGIAVRNYILDTEYLWFSWFSELNKSLAFVSSILLYDAYYWKEEGAGDRHDLWKYCAKDCWYTARNLILMLQHMPPWAKQNYSVKFPEVFSAVNVKFFGFLVDQEKHHELRAEAEAELDAAKASLTVMADEPDFNPGSWQQVSKLLYDILGAKKPARRGRGASKAGTDESTLKKIALQHPLIERFVGHILEYRGQRKAIGTYYDAALFHGRLKFGQNIDGTTTGRHSSNSLPMYVPNPSGKKKDEKNYGTQIQNIPPYMRKCLQADPGFRLGEVDKKQSEARCTAYQSQDLDLIRGLESGEDFYIYTTRRFFGISLDPDDPTLHDKGSLRQITKKIIHGTNYMMGPETFIDAFIKEIGFTELRKAQALLNMEKVPLIEFAAYLLGLYHKGYPRVPKWWNETKLALIKTNRIVTADGWTRLFFGDVKTDHKRLRDAVAHQPQHLSVAGINKSMWRLLNLQIESKGEYILMAQVHDSIMFQAKIEKFDYYMSKTLELMHHIDNINGRTLIIPLEANYGTHWKPMEEWKNVA